MQERPFAELQNELVGEFLRAAPQGETSEELGCALLELILKSERIRRGASESGFGAVDQETINRLSNQTDLGSEFAVPEAVFKRLAIDPAAAIGYLKEELQKRSSMQAERAKSLRQGSYDSITRLIMDILTDEPLMKSAKVLAELRNIDGILIADGEIRNTQDAATMKISNFASRVSDARKRISG